jgi:peptidoglycan hydrolase CwlO-like protein
MIFVPIILLNLLIALMSDSFENIQDRAFVELNMLRAKIIEEQKYGLFSFFSKRLSTNKEQERYLHVVVPKGENRAKLPTEEYQGVLNAMKRDVGEVKADVKKQVDEVKKQVDDVKKQVDDVKTQIDDLKQWMMTHLQRDSVVDSSP